MDQGIEVNVKLAEAYYAEGIDYIMPIGLLPRYGLTLIAYSTTDWRYQPTISSTITKKHRG